MSDFGIWVESQPSQSRPGSGQATRSGSAWIQDASLGLIVSTYNNAGWTNYHWRSYSALGDGFTINHNPQYQVVRQQVIHHLQDLVKQDDGNTDYHSGKLEGLPKPPTTFKVQANHQEVLVNGKWIQGLAEDGGNLVTLTLPNGLSKTVHDQAGNQFRIPLRWVPQNEEKPTPKSGILLGYVTCHSQREYHTVGSWHHPKYEVTGLEWQGTCQLGRKLIDRYWTQGDPEKARSIINDNLDRTLGVRLK